MKLDPIPKKEDRIPEPSHDEYVKKMQALDEEINKKRDLIQTINKQKREKIHGRREAREKRDKEEAKAKGTKTFKEVLAEKRAVQKEVSAFKADLEKAEHILASVTEEERVILKNCSPKYKSEKAVNARIAELTTKINTESLAPAQEKDIHKEISFLKKSIEYVARLDVIAPKKDEAKALKDSVKKERGKLIPKLKSYDKILDAMTAEFKANAENREENKEELDALEEKIQTLKTEISEVFEKKNVVKEEHYKAMYEWACEKDKIGYLEFQHRRQEKLKKDQEWKAKKQQEEADRRAAQPNPYED